MMCLNEAPPMRHGTTFAAAAARSNFAESAEVFAVLFSECFSCLIILVGWFWSNGLSL